MLFEATRVAAAAHDGQFRKGTRIPYLVHPLRVGAILSHAGLGDTVVAAAILHDTIEDTAVTIEDLRERFSPEVCELVLTATEPDKSAPWESRKERTVRGLESRSAEALCLLAADKIDNLESLAENLDVEGEAAWERFSRGRRKQRWFYTSVLREIEAAGRRIAEAHPGPRSDAPATALRRLTERLGRAVARVFPQEVP